MNYSDTVECKMQQWFIDEVTDDNSLFACLYFEREINPIRTRLIQRFWEDTDMVMRIERDYHRIKLYMIPGGDFELDKPT